MKTTRLLLPFIHGVDKFAIEQAILLAKSHQAILVPLALIHIPEECRRKGVRLEYMQQSMDFLETVKQKADWYTVPVEKVEVFTSQVVQSINFVACEKKCEGILLFQSTKGGILLEENQITRLIEMPACKLYVTHLPTIEHMSFIQELRQRFSHWIHTRNVGQGKQVPQYLEEDVELSIEHEILQV